MEVSNRIETTLKGFKEDMVKMSTLHQRSAWRGFRACHVGCVAVVLERQVCSLMQTAAR